jgi:anti-sigma factor RsiW
MNCEEANDLTSRFVDNELEAGSQDRLFEHLSVCPDCQSFLRAVLQIRKVIEREAVAFPEEIDAQVLGKLNGRKSPPLWKRSWRVPLPVAAAAMLLVAMGVTTSFLLALSGADSPGRPGANTRRNYQTASVVCVLPPLQVTAEDAVNIIEDSVN